MSESLLEPNADEANAFLSKLIMDSGGDAAALEQMLGGSSPAPYTTIIPKPGFCLKIKMENNEKIFINVCHSEHVPEPPDISDNELLELLKSDDPAVYRVPMGVGEPHAELDKSGKGCTAYEIVINPKFLEKIKTNQVFQTFFLSVLCEALEEKYNLQLQREWVMLKNKKFMGSLLQQNIRNKSKPFIVEMEKNKSLLDKTPERKTPLIQEVKSQGNEKKKAPEPPFTIIQEPAEGYPEFLVAEIHLPKVKTAGTLILDVGEDRIRLDTRSNAYYLDIFLPYNLVQEECGAQFHRKTKILTITMPVQPEKH